MGFAVIFVLFLTGCWCWCWWGSSAADEPSSSPLSLSPTGEDVVLSSLSRCLVLVKSILSAPIKLWVCTLDRLFLISHSSLLWQQLNGDGGFSLNGLRQARSLVSRATSAAWTYTHFFVTDKLWSCLHDFTGRLLSALRLAIQLVRNKTLEGVRWVYIYSSLLGLKATSQCQGKVDCTHGTTVTTTSTPSAPLLSSVNSTINDTVLAQEPARLTRMPSILTWLRNTFTFLFPSKQEAAGSQRPLLRSDETRHGSSRVSRRARPPGEGSSTD
ncbi:hypothetical protein TraAM80_01014 [Trypanosoma rangeli]|uniref:Secreted protein n=1 Tax=Trypanosoma rangeli TaxID=5698 RepID=A0A3R7KX18_TRYRA|nr:uncharacterized protein TraAM80_01014 [Trypanosoma rangeli]RNF11397.1 hypothetical protein TraAM80_01014 [Trypanosoma rangeli]|eukprot:RNF11397.1 hypothetical protein TraAM80_01014 [Trypanosoma rangeli]